MVECVRDLLHISIRYLLLYRRSRTIEEVRLDRSIRRLRISEVVPANSVGQRQPPVHLPGVLRKDASSIAYDPIAASKVSGLLASQQVVRYARFGIDLVLHEVRNRLEGKGRDGIQRRKQQMTIAPESFIADLQVMGAVDVRQRIAPHIVILDVVLVCLAYADLRIPGSGYLDDRHMERPGRIDQTLHAKHTEGC